MRTIYFLWLLFPWHLMAQEFQLAKPILRYNSAFFEKKAEVEMEFAMHGAQIHYTLNGTEPTLQSPVFRKKLKLKKRCVLQARVFAPGYRPSEVEKVSFYQLSNTVFSVNATKANPQYPGNGPQILSDKLGGTVDYSNGQWMGYDVDTAIFDIKFASQTPVTEVGLEFLHHEASWIFPPSRIVLSYFDVASQKFEIILEKKYDLQPNSAKSTEIASLSVGQPIKTTAIRIEVFPLKSIPEAHPGAGQHAWFFIDEIFVK